jgi:hypothetical protein
MNNAGVSPSNAAHLAVARNLAGDGAVADLAAVCTSQDANARTANLRRSLLKSSDMGVGDVEIADMAAGQQFLPDSNIVFPHRVDGDA